MSQIFMRGAELPGKVRGVTIEMGDDFIIIVNTCLCAETQRKAAEHELQHIRLDHFYDDEPVVINEMEAR